MVQRRPRGPNSTLRRRNRMSQRRDRDYILGRLPRARLCVSATSGNRAHARARYGPPVVEADQTLAITIILTAYHEERRIRAKIRNLLGRRPCAPRSWSQQMPRRSTLTAGKPRPQHSRGSSSLTNARCEGSATPSRVPRQPGNAFSRATHAPIALPISVTASVWQKSIQAPNKRVGNRWRGQARNYWFTWATSRGPSATYTSVERLHDRARHNREWN